MLLLSCIPGAISLTWDTAQLTNVETEDNALLNLVGGKFNFKNAKYRYAIKV